MAFDKKTWANNQGGGTPLDASGLNDLESRIDDSIDELDVGIGNRTYTEQNVVTNGQSITASINELDKGVIVESGSNANGHYVKWADGTMECWGTIDVQLSNSVGTSLKGFPQPFINTEIFIMQSPSLVHGQSSVEVRRITSGSRPNSISNFYVYAAHSSATGINYLITFMYRAIGRWKA